MGKTGKKQSEAKSKIDRGIQYSPTDASRLLKESVWANFDEAVEVHVRLGIDPRQADQAIRTSVSLPHGTGKEVSVLVFAEGEASRVAANAGADHVGSDDIVAKIEQGWLDFDATVAMADMMSKVGSLGRILGRRGLMPNPKSGTVVRDVEDLASVIGDLKGGRVEFRNDRHGIVHTVIGKKHFTEEQIEENFNIFVDALVRAKPSGLKGDYMRSLTLTSTMGPGIRVNIPEALAAAAASSQ